MSETETKTETSGVKYDSSKPRYDLLPPLAIESMAQVLTFGAAKYAPDNWRKVDDALNRYRAALLRHTFAMQRGEVFDPETGQPHAAHVMCCAAFIAELELEAHHGVPRQDERLGVEPASQHKLDLSFADPSLAQAFYAKAPLHVRRMPTYERGLEDAE